MDSMGIIFVALCVMFAVFTVLKPDAALKLWNCRYDPELEKEKLRQKHEREKEAREDRRSAARLGIRIARRFFK